MRVGVQNTLQDKLQTELGHGRGTETETLSELPGCGSELLFLCAFVIESRNDKGFWPSPATTTYMGEPRP